MRRAPGSEGRVTGRTPPRGPGVGGEGEGEGSRPVWEVGRFWVQLRKPSPRRAHSSEFITLDCKLYSKKLIK